MSVLRFEFPKFRNFELTPVKRSIAHMHKVTLQYSFLTVDDFYPILIILQTVWIQIRTDRMSVLIWSQTSCSLIVFVKGCFRKVRFEKKIEDIQQQK